ncbi:BLUF domain-containing protein [Corynebacterium testudinoris]|nr:BLUF domain-containing protein [Corynebacterium testudinoris]
MSEPGDMVPAGTTTSISNPLRYLVYTSIAAGHPGNEEMEEILTAARSHNADADITGFLLYRDFRFVQFLEGSPEAIGSLMESIARDPRHTDVRVIIDEPGAARSFPNWSMGFRIPEPSKKHPLADMRDSFSDATTSTDQDVISRAIREFSLWIKVREAEDAVGVPAS